MQIEWEPKIGPASIVGAVGAVCTIISVIWVGSSYYQKVVDRIDDQSTKLTESISDSKERFKTISTTIQNNKTMQDSVSDRLSKVETAIVYISNQVQRVETKLDGGQPPAPALPATK